MTSIGSGAFFYCSSLTSINIPNSVTKIGDYAFRDCSSLTSINIPNSVTKIGNNAFYSCSSLTSINIGSSIKDIDANAFASCAKLQDVYCYSENVPSTQADSFKDSYIDYATLHVPAASINLYKTAEPWKNFKSIVAIDGGSEMTKCAAPTISYKDGKLSLACETEGAEYVTDITDTDIKKHYDATISLTATYNISVYTTKSGYENSDIATATLCWIDQQPTTEGITDGVGQIASRAVLVKTDNGFVTVEGVENDTNVSVYTVDGKQFDGKWRMLGEENGQVLLVSANYVDFEGSTEKSGVPTITLQGSNGIDNEIDWCAENALLKAEFPLGVSNPKATYDLGLGSIQRSTNTDTQYEVCSHEWTDLTDVSGDYGVTILNDSRYGWDKPTDNTLRLSLLYAPKPGGGYTYQAHQDKGYHVFSYSIVGHQGALSTTHAAQQATALNSPLRAFVVSKHKGALGREWSFLQSDNEHVVVRTMKRAEVSDEYVVRIHELSGKSHQTAHLTFPVDIEQAVEADGTERTISAASFSGRQLTVNVEPYSVKTYKVKLASVQPLPSEGIYQTVSLPFNRKCATFNEFRSEADFENGYSYAAELFPDSLTAGGVPFTFGERESLNGLSCHGDTLTLPASAAPSHLYLLVASNQGDRQAVFQMGKQQQQVDIPFYSGFVGQWGHKGQTEGFLKPAEVAWIGTHRHSAAQDEPYEFTYMYKVRLDLPKGCRQVVVPADEHVVIFAATLFSGTLAEGTPASRLFLTSNGENRAK